MNNDLHAVMADDYSISDDSITFFLDNKPVFIAFKTSIDYISIKY